MKKSLRILWIIMLCVVMSVAVACLSACSILLATLEDEEETSEGGSGVAGTYTVDVTLYDEDWYNNVVDSTMWSTTAGVGAYAYDTLVLSSDGSYALTKEMGADEVATERWSTDNGATDKHFSTYTYYGTYTVASDGKTVTLSEVTKIAYEVDTFEISISQGVGYVVEYTETTDLESTAGTLSGDTVIDLYYGIYLVNSGYGNCSQIITLGTTDYGDFEFSGLASGSSGSSNTETTVSYDFVTYDSDSKEISGVTLSVYEDGTYTFTDVGNSVSESGTYTWDRLTMALVFVYPDDDHTTITATISTSDMDTISFEYYYTADNSIKYAFVGSVEGLEELICEVVFEFIPTSSTSYSLRIYSDKTYTYTDKSTSTAVVRESGSYKLDAESKQLILTLPGALSDKTTAISSTYEGNLMYIEYTAYADESSTQKFVASLTDALADIPSAEVIYSFAPGSGNSAIYLELYNNNTYEFGYTTYGVTETGKWYYIGGELSFVSDVGSTLTATITDGVIYVDYDYMGGGQLTQTFIGAVSDLNQVLDIVYIFSVSDPKTLSAGNYFGINLYSDGTYLVEYYMGSYGRIAAEESGNWYYIGGDLCFTTSVSSTFDITISGDSITIAYDYAGGGALTQTFAGSISELNEALDIIYVFSVSDPTTLSSGNYFGIKLYSDGTFAVECIMGGHYVPDTGTWTYSSGSLSLVSSVNSTLNVTINSDSISIYYEYAYSSGLNQTVAGSVTELESAISAATATTTASVVYEFTPTNVTEGNSMELILYSDGTYQFKYTLWSIYTGSESGWYLWDEDSQTLSIVQCTETDYSYYTLISYSLINSSIDEDDSSIVWVKYVSPASTALSNSFYGSITDLAAALGSD